ncbi:MAG TPA: MFS transporter [Dongiaceae bacterium]|nr:MFS transporter [Dongiaceae bacterium]
MTALPFAAESLAASAWRSIAIGLIAFLTLVDLFAAQALLPTLARAYGVSPAAMGTAVNACTFGMAISSLLVAFLSRRIERRRGIWISLALLSIPTTLLSIAPNLTVFAILRVTQGMFMAAAFALTLAFLGERFSARASTSAFAAYVTGNVASNLFGRLMATAMTDQFGLSGAFYLFAALNLCGAILAFLVIRRSQPMRAAAEEQVSFAAWIVRLRNPAILCCLGIGFCILFAFIGTFTYVNFVLVAPPFELGMMSLGLIYFVFVPSIVTTPFGGRIVRHFGVRTTLWAALGIAALGIPLVLGGNLTAMVSGLALIGVGTFLAQAAATGFISAAATFDRGVASGLYLASYFLGGLVGSFVLGQLYGRFGWPACVAGVGAALALAALLTVALQRPEDRQDRANMLPRHRTDRKSAMAAVGRLRDAPISNAFC